MDLGVLAMLGGAAAAGWRAGLLAGAGTAAGVAAGYLLAAEHAPALGALVTPNKHGWLLGYAFLVGAGGGVGLLAGLTIKKASSALRFGMADRLGGVAAALAVALFAVSVAVVLLANSSHTPPWVARGLWRSDIALQIARNADQVRASMPEDL